MSSAADRLAEAVRAFLGYHALRAYMLERHEEPGEIVGSVIDDAKAALAAYDAERKREER